jgi:hypothetical protein
MALRALLWLSRVWRLFVISLMLMLTISDDWEKRGQPQVASLLVAVI